MTQTAQTNIRAVFWGTYDTGKPRVRILLQGLRENHVDVIECHRDVWNGIEDKSQVRGVRGKLLALLRWLMAYPTLIWRYLQLPEHDLVIVSYMGQLDVLVLWPFAKVKGKPIVWDTFLSLYNTVVEDRKLLSRRNPVAWLLWSLEWLACKAADLVVVDTDAHGRYFSHKFSVPSTKIRRVFVGAETCTFGHDRPKRPPGSAQAPVVLFYGQFIPLHGIPTVVEAAKLTESEDIRWIIVGNGQEAPKVRALLEQLHPNNLEWVPWIPYSELGEALSNADICLGIFGDTDKAARVIPNKVFQILMSGRPLITRDSPAIRELVSKDDEGVWLIPPASPTILADTVRQATRSHLPPALHSEIKNTITPKTIGETFLFHLRCLLSPSA